MEKSEEKRMREMEAMCAMQGGIAMVLHILEDRDKQREWYQGVIDKLSRDVYELRQKADHYRERLYKMELVNVELTRAQPEQRGEEDATND